MTDSHFPEYIPNRLKRKTLIISKENIHHTTDDIQETSTQVRQLVASASRRSGSLCAPECEVDIVEGVSLLVYNFINISTCQKYDTSQHFSILNSVITPKILSQNEVRDFIHSIYTNCIVEYDCMVIAMIYVERAMYITNNEFRICLSNWKASIYACILLACKVWDDFTMNNAAFAALFSSMRLNRLNKIERLFLFDILQCQCCVSVAEYTTCNMSIYDKLKSRKHDMILHRLETCTYELERNTSASRKQYTSQDSLVRHEDEYGHGLYSGSKDDNNSNSKEDNSIVLMRTESIICEYGDYVDIDNDNDGNNDGQVDINGNTTNNGIVVTSNEEEHNNTTSNTNDTLQHINDHHTLVHSANNNNSKSNPDILDWLVGKAMDVLSFSKHRRSPSLNKCYIINEDN
jgi:hypothetical protein